MHVELAALTIEGNPNPYPTIYAAFIDYNFEQIDQQLLQTYVISDQASWQLFFSFCVLVVLLLMTTMSVARQLCESLQDQWIRQCLQALKF
mgnify:CR=1 FL=1